MLKCFFCVCVCVGFGFIAFARFGIELTCAVVWCAFVCLCVFVCVCVWYVCLRVLRVTYGVVCVCGLPFVVFYLFACAFCKLVCAMCV